MFLTKMEVMMSKFKSAILLVAFGLISSQVFAMQNPQINEQINNNDVQPVVRENLEPRLGRGFIGLANRAMVAAIILILTDYTDQAIEFVDNQKSTRFFRVCNFSAMMAGQNLGHPSYFSRCPPTEFDGEFKLFFLGLVAVWVCQMFALTDVLAEDIILWFNTRNV